MHYAGERGVEFRTAHNNLNAEVLNFRRTEQEAVVGGVIHNVVLVFYEYIWTSAHGSGVLALEQFDEGRIVHGYAVFIQRAREAFGVIMHRGNFNAHLKMAVGSIPLMTTWMNSRSTPSSQVSVPD
jgi:hypothetical protein